MLGVKDAVHDGVPQVQIRRSHIDLGPQSARAVGKFAGLHAREQIQVFFDRSVAIGALLARLGPCAALLPQLIRRQVVDIRFARADQLYGPVICKLLNRKYSEA